MPTIDEAVSATLAEGAGPPEDDAIGSAVQSVLSEDRTALRSSLYGAAGGSPDEAAKAAKLARTTGKPGEVILRNLREVERLALVDELEQKAFASPALAKRMREDRIFAQQAQDDADTLGGIETTLRTLKNIPASIAKAFPSAGAGLWGAASAPFEVAGQVFGTAEASLARFMGADGYTPSNAATTAGEFLRNEQRAAQAVAQRVGPDVVPGAGVVERGVYSGFQSAMQTLITLPIALRQGGENIALGIMGAIQGGESYGKAREKLDPARAAVFGTVQGVAEAAFERAPMLQFIKDVKAGSALGTMLVNNLKNEVPGEIATTLVQNFNEWVTLNPDKSVGQWIAEQPEAIAETIVATMVGAGAQTGAVKGIQAVAERFGGEDRRAQQGEQAAATAETLAKLAEASKLRGRDAESFREFVQQVADEEGDAPTEFYIDGAVLANTLNQSGVTMQELEAIAPVVASQLEAAMTGGDVRVPVSEFLTAGEALTAPLVDHLRMTPDGMSRAEAQDYMKEQGDRIQREVETELQRVDDQAQFRQSIEAVRAEFEAELGNAKRFTADVNRAYADLLANFYGATAARLGMTPQELLAKYRLRVQSKLADGQRVMEQGAPDTPEFRNWFGDSKVVDQQGRPLVVYHGTTATDTKQGNRREGDAGARAELQRLAKTHGIAEWDSVASVFERWVDMGQAAQFGIRSADALRARRLMRTAKTVADGPVTDIGFTVFNLPAGEKELGAHFGTVNQAAARGVPFAFYLAIQNPLRLPDLGTWDYQSVMREARKRGVNISEGEYDAVFNANDNNGALRKLLLSKGIDGVVYKNEAEGKGDSYIAFRPEQIKSAIGNRGTFDPADPSILNQGGNGFDAWVGDAERVDLGGVHEFKAGEPVVVAALHGTTGDFTSFDNAMANIESDLGGGFYFTNNPADVGENYAGMGPDLTQKIQNEAERLESNDELDPDEAMRIARDKWMANEGLTMPVWVKFENPVVLGGQSETFLTYEENYNEELDEYEEPTGTLLDVIEALREVASDERYGDGDVEQAISDVMEKAAENGGLSAREFIAAAKLSEGLVYVADYESDGKLASTEVLRRAFEAAGFDGFIDTTVNEKFGSESEAARKYDKAMAGMDETTVHFIAFKPTQIKSRLGNDGSFDANDPNILSQQGGAPRAQIALPQDITASPSVIGLLQGADLSSFIHESGHFFLEVQADLAIKIQQQIASGASVTAGERSIVDDMNRLLDWFGVKGDENLPPLQAWAMMSLEEKRASHEQFARGFEAYAFEGKAPSLELQSIFQRFRSWLLQVYQTLRNLNVELNDDVRAVMGRMLASDFAIEETEAARNMGPLFKDAESAGMTLDEFNAYQGLARGATEDAIAQLQARGLKDMRWLSRARDKALKARQQEVEELRREVRQEVRAEVLTEPVYRAWQFLTGRVSDADKVDAPAVRKSVPGPVDNTVDSMFVAIAKMGGLRRDAAAADLGIDPKQRSPMPLFGKPLLLRDGGLTQDAMAERLGEQGYLTLDENGKVDIAEFHEKFQAELRGIKQYSYAKDYADAQGLAADAGLNIDGAERGKLDLSALIERYGPADARIAKLKALRMTAKAGWDFDAVAENFGFDSGDALVVALTEATPPAETIEARTDQRMLEMFGDITSPQALQRAADEAVHNEARARVIAAELKALQDANTVREDTGKRTKQGRKVTVDVMARAAKDYAQQIIGRLKVREIRPAQYAAAEARNAKLAEKALAAGKTDEAAMHKRNQLVNNHATKAAYEAQAEVEQITAYFRRFEKRPKSVDPGYLDQIEGLLERFDFRNASLKEIDRRKSFKAWYDEQVADGMVPEIADDLLDEANRKSYKDMTVEELRGLRDAVKNIEHLGKLKNRLLTARDQRTFDAAAEDIAGTVRQFGGKAREVKLEGEKGFRYWLEGIAAMHRKLSSLFRQMDGGRDDGPLYEHIVRPMNERGAWEDSRIEQATVALSKLYAPLLKMRGGITGTRSKVFIPEIKASLTRGGRLAVALNWGNADNRQRIMEGDKWSEGQVRAILGTLTAEELNFVNGVWEFIDSYWPEIAEKEKRVTGIAPEKVKADPFTVQSADGATVQMRGGYYPLKYDTDRSDRAESQEAAQVAKEMMRGATTRATTRRGHTKERVKEVKRAVRKDLGVITQHVKQVVHDLAWHEWLIDTNRLLRDDRVVGAIREHYGPKVLKTIRDDVAGIATADVLPMTDVDKALLALRSNVSRATMGASITTAFLQPFGLTQSMARIGSGHVLRGAARWMGDAAKFESSLTWVREKSEFMRLRSKTFNRELREVSSAVEGKTAAMRAIDGGLFWLMQKMQLVADVPTWIGQYEKTLAQYPEIDETDEAAVARREAEAVGQADRAVIEAQGSGQPKDLAEIQRKYPLLTQFYSYFSVTANLIAEKTGTTDFKNPRAVAGWLGDMALLAVIPAIVPALLMHLLRGGGKDDEPDKWAKRIAQWQVGYLLGAVVGLREFSGAVQGFDYTGPPVGRIVGDITKAGKQTAQGEVDEPMVLAYINVLGTALGIPVVQLTRSYKGWKAWDEGEAGAQAILLGPPRKE